MASCFYQKLASVEVIPLEYTNARNIINLFAEENDGYKVLYSLIEPFLYHEEISKMPKVTTCSDVHEYSLKVQSYFACIAHGSRSICSSKALSMTHSLNLQLNAQDAYWIIKTRKTQQFLQPSISPYCQTPSNVTLVKRQDVRL